MNKLLFLSGLLWISATVLAQDQPIFTEQSEFINNLKQEVSKLKNYGYNQKVQLFESETWNNTQLDVVSKLKIVECARKMRKRGIKPLSYVLMLATIQQAILQPDITQEKLMHFLDCLSKTIDYQEEPMLNHFLSTSTLFFKDKYFFRGLYNGVSIQGGEADFAYEGIAASLDNNQSQQTNEGTSTEANPAATEPEEPAPIESTSTLPALDGPVIKFTNTTIRLGSRSDTLKITGTSGAYSFQNSQIQGAKGKISWGDIFIQDPLISAELDEYVFSAKNNILIVDNCTLEYPEKLEAPAKGHLEFRHSRKDAKGNTSFPRFISNTNDVGIKNLASNMKFTGGFSLAGKQIGSASMDQSTSVLEYNDGKRRFKILAPTFSFKDSTISSDQCEAMVFLENDTLMHPGVAFFFDIYGKRMKLHRENGPYKNTLFHDSYHKLEFSVDVLDWPLDADTIALDIYAAKSQIPAMFKSVGYFSEREFTQLQGLSPYHPLRILFNYMRIAKTRELIDGDIVKKFQLNYKTFQGAMNDLMRKGFVKYNPVSGEILLKAKALHHMKAFVGGADYDNLYIPSLVPKGANATLLLDSNVLVVRGVKKFFVSDSSNVWVLPSNNTVKVYYNRELNFDGTMVAGIYYMEGKNFRMHYDDFLVECPSIDTIRFAVREKSNDGKSKDGFAGNELVFSSGTLFINEPNNKAGRHKYPQYPKFDSNGAYVYFTSRKILGGAYDRRVVFKVSPFVSDSVKSADKSSIKFNGTFVSGGIFPDFEETLVMQPDKSLGFTHKTPKEGYNIYQGKGTFIGTITMNNGGIRGSGELKYLSGTYYSNDFVFYQDSLVAHGQQAKIKEKVIDEVYFPEVDIADFEMRYVERDDSMHLVNINHPFSMYKNQVILEGSMRIAKSGINGEGMMEINKIKVIGHDFHFFEKNISCRHAVFNYKSKESPKPSFIANNVRSDFDLTQKKVSIFPEVKGMVSIFFPLNEFNTSIETATWDLNKKLIYMQAEDENNIYGSFFYSTKEELDSVAFNAAKASYDISKKLLIVEGVPFIKIADVNIIPDSNKVLIKESAEIKPFKQARLEIDTLNKYHKLYKGRIEIISRHKFVGTAFLTYKNAAGDTSRLVVQNFGTEESILNKKETLRYTVGEIEIKEKDNFFIAPKILFKGQAKLKAISPFLAYKGKIKIDLKSKDVRSDWFPFENDGSSADVIVHLDQPKSKPAGKTPPASVSDTTSIDESTVQEPTQVYTGLFYESGSHDIYTTVASAKKNEDDVICFNVGGQLIYDQMSKSILVGDPQKLVGDKKYLPMYTYNDSSFTAYSEGKLDLIHTDANFGLITAGKVKVGIDSSKFEFKGIMHIRPQMPGKALDIMHAHIEELFSEKIPADTLRHEDIQSMSYALGICGGEKVAKAYLTAKEDMSDLPAFKFYGKLAEGITIEQLDLKWSHEQKSWYGYGHLAITNILTKEIQHKIKAYIELRKTLPDDVFTLYLRPRKDVWYFLRYEQGRLSLHSSHTEFNDYIRSKSKGETGTPAIYTFVESDYTERLLFIKEFYKHYLGSEYNADEEEKPLDTDPSVMPNGEDTMENQSELSAPSESVGEIGTEPEAPKTKSKKSKKGKKQEDSPASDEPQPSETAPDNEVGGSPPPKPPKKSKKEKKKEVEEDLELPGDGN